MGRPERTSVRGPFCTPGKRIVFVVEKYIFLQSELLDLLAQNKLDRGGLQELAKRIEGELQTVKLILTNY